MRRRRRAIVPSRRGGWGSASLTGCLAHFGGAAARAVAAGAPALALKALAAHRGSAPALIAGCELLRCLAEAGGAAPEGLAEAAQGAKRAQPKDPAVHRAADLLLGYVVPRTAAALGALMDGARGDEARRAGGRGRQRRRPPEHMGSIAAAHGTAAALGIAAAHAESASTGLGTA